MSTGSRAALLAVAFLARLPLPDAHADAGTATACAEYAPPERTGKVPSELPELSGLAASRVHDGIYWAHNDSGNAFEVFGIEKTGKIRARIELTGAKARDIEDIAVGPCGPGDSSSCIYLGDIGDNRYRHRESRIYRVPEPPALEDQSIRADVLVFRWSDGPQNAEAMVVDPRSATVFLWTKESRSLGIVHRLENLQPGKTGRTVVVKRIQPDEPGAVMPTGADVHPSGDRIIIRTYSQAWELRREDASNLEQVLETKPIRVPAPRQGQSEAVSYTRDGRGYILGSEGTGSALYAVGCEDSGTSRSSSSSSARTHAAVSSGRSGMRARKSSRFSPTTPEERFATSISW